MDDWTGYCRVVDVQKIILSKSDREVLAQHAEEHKPNESCAILFGNDGSAVLEVFLTENIAESPTNFTISDEQLMQVYDMEKEKGLNVIGIFHSHPNTDAYPSETDKKFMQVNPVVWIIYSGASKDFRAYVLKSEITEIQITEEEEEEEE